MPPEVLDMYNEWALPSGKTIRGTDDNMTGQCIIARGYWMGRDKMLWKVL